MNHLPIQLYSASATRELDRIAINEFGIPGYTLMTRAGETIFKIMQQEYPLAKRILVCCGAGNNAGDGYVIARLAHRAGLDVEVLSLSDTAKLTGDALQAFQDWKSQGLHTTSKLKPELLDRIDLVIDALLGTGLDREVSGEWQQVIARINQCKVPVIAVDIPSGLSADTGEVLGDAIRADITVTFIGLKKGLFTHHGPDYTGRLFFDALGVPEPVYKSVIPDAELLNWDQLKIRFTPRRRNSHKKNYGHVLIVGGNQGMAGAARLAGEAALRTGAGLVSVVTRPEHVTIITSGCPELMVTGTDTGSIPSQLLNRVDCIVIGPGLGQDQWAQTLLARVLQSRQPKLLDADALNLLSSQDTARQDWILTPHPGEAATLLGVSTAEVQQNRFLAAQQLQQHYGGVVVLKGCGTLIQQNKLTRLCPYGNPGMASAGMGDVLCGVIAALIAQGFSLSDAADTGACLHARAGDLAAEQGERGMLASDLFPFLRHLVNPGLSK